MGEYQSITRFDDKAYQELPGDFDVEEKKINPLGLRHLDVTVSLNIDGIKGHLPVVRTAHLCLRVSTICVWDLLI